jgi:uncharacterized protein YdaU (DUF1376 family)
MKRAWMPLYVGDYLGDTGHLTTAQHGAYLLLMMHYWRKGELPDDDGQLAKIAKLPLRTWVDYRPVLQAFFHDGWKHKRIETELARMMRVSEKRSVAGQKGGLGSALSRMKLENSARTRPSRQAIASVCSSKAQAIVDHSHSHSQNLSYGPSKSEASKADSNSDASKSHAPKSDASKADASEADPSKAEASRTDSSRAGAGKAVIPISAELAALMARKS